MKSTGSTAGAPPAFSPLASNRRQPVLVTLAVLLAHAALLVYVQTRPAAVQPPEPPAVMMELLASSPAPVAVSPPAPRPEPRKSAPAAPKPIPQPTPRPAPVKAASTAVAQPEPSPLPGAAPSPAPAQAAPSSNPAPAAVPAAASSASASAAPAPAKVELPSASADYLNNPKPAYPPLSRRLREEGQVVLRVLIETDGSAAKAEIRSSSGYERLDQAALRTVLKWRYLPAKRNGVPEPMWFNVPINFVLE